MATINGEDLDIFIDIPSRYSKSYINTKKYASYKMYMFSLCFYVCVAVCRVIVSWLPRDLWWQGLDDTGPSVIVWWPLGKDGRSARMSICNLPLMLRLGFVLL